MKTKHLLKKLLTLQENTKHSMIDRIPDTIKLSELIVILKFIKEEGHGDA